MDIDDYVNRFRETQALTFQRFSYMRRSSAGTVPPPSSRWREVARSRRWVVTSELLQRRHAQHQPLDARRAEINRDYGVTALVLRVDDGAQPVLVMRDLVTGMEVGDVEVIVLAERRGRFGRRER